MTNGPDSGQALRTAVVLVTLDLAVAAVLGGLADFARRLGGGWWTYLLGATFVVAAGYLVIALAVRFERRAGEPSRPATADWDGEASR